MHESLLYVCIYPYLEHIFISQFIFIPCCRIVKEEEMKFLDSKAEIRERSADRQVAHVENSVPNAMLTYASVICYSRTMCLHCGQTFRGCGAELSS